MAEANRDDVFEDECRRHLCLLPSVLHDVIRVVVEFMVRRPGLRLYQYVCSFSIT
jgi:hypothetical protein